MFRSPRTVARALPPALVKLSQSILKGRTTIVKVRDQGTGKEAGLLFHGIDGIPTGHCVMYWLKNNHELVNFQPSTHKLILLIGPPPPKTPAPPATHSPHGP
jgi:hypothetical protein